MHGLKAVASSLIILPFHTGLTRPRFFGLRIKRVVLQNKNILSIIVFMGLLFNSMPSVQGALGSSLSKQFEQEGAFRSFYKKISSIATVPYDDARAIWRWGLKKLSGQKIEEKDRLEVKKIIVHAGLTIGAVLSLIFVAYYTYDFLFAKPSIDEILHTEDSGAGALVLQVVDPSLTRLYEKVFSVVQNAFPEIKKDLSKLPLESIDKFRTLKSIIEKTAIVDDDIKESRGKKITLFRVAIKKRLVAILNLSGHELALLVRKVTDEQKKLSLGDLETFLKKMVDNQLDVLINKQTKELQIINEMKVEGVGQALHITICKCDKLNGCDQEKIKKEIEKIITNKGTFKVTGIRLLGFDRIWIVLEIESDDLRKVYDEIVGNPECRCAAVQKGKYNPHISVVKIIADKKILAFQQYITTRVEKEARSTLPSPSIVYQFAKKDIKYFASEYVPVFDSKYALVEKSERVIKFV